MKKIRITAVSYLNTLPFVYGLRKLLDIAKYELSLDVPAGCAEKILKQEVDAGLAPAGILAYTGDVFTRGNYCIAADGPVNSVLLLSRVPLDSIKEIHLDTDSRTSVLLVRVLASQFWGIEPVYTSHACLPQDSCPPTMLVIGDKAFDLSSSYEYAYDLSSEWKKYTGLPFVFAIWVFHKTLPVSEVLAIEEALAAGLSHIPDVVSDRLAQGPVAVDLYQYLTKDIRFRMEGPYRQGLELFLTYAQSLRSA